ncbi:glycosyltransferase [Phycicoccus sp. M110.8]|uniref:glycosyltransferase n=1 Tax=Phycicoccus sp. M110.8 TaxID=3075433 RepID=UPI0028FD6F20|nr:glycosyltransferase [Phycicoccus sp. M110.8]MDU0314722.1 glycosyltransferase [Phycicoccus sp. M110.8]
MIDVEPLARSLQVNRDRVAADVWCLVRHRLWKSILMYAFAILAGAAGRPVNPWRQRVWFSGRSGLQRVAEHFDAAFAVSSGPSTYFLVDCVESSRSYHWVIGDYSQTPIARRVDVHYLSQLRGGLAVSDECADIFTKVFPELKARRPKPYQFQTPWRFYEHNEGGIPEFETGAGAKIVTVSRLDPGKGLGLALEAAAELRDVGLEFRWLVLGDGPERTRLTDQIERLGLEELVVLCGFKNNVSQYLRAADVFVLPSSSEGRSTAVDEAMELGVIPVITDFKTARSQVTDGRTGVISSFKPGDLARSIASALDPAVRATILPNIGITRDEDPTPFFVKLSS